MRRIHGSVRYLATLVLWGGLSSSQAAIVVNGTRVIFNEAANETTVQLRNVGEQAVLAQVWVDDGDFAATPEGATSPFILTPPVVRIDPGAGQAIRLIRKDGVPERQRETLYWLNVVEVPPKPSANLAAGDNLLMFSFRTRLKVFYRPVALASGAERAHEHLCFRYDAASEKLHARNPSPFHVTFRRAALERADGSVVGELLREQDRMIGPGGHRAFALRMTGNPSSDMAVRYSVINDHGGDTWGQGENATSCPM